LTSVNFAPESRRRQRQTERLRKVGGVFALLLFLAAVVASLAMLGLGVRAVLFSKNSHFTLRQIEAASDGRLRDRDLIAALADLGVVPGEVNLFAISLKKLRHQLGQHPQTRALVREAHLSRQLPGTLKVRIFERHPVMRLRNGKLVDREGRVLPARSDPLAQALPMIAGLRETKEAEDGDILNDPLLRAALHFLILTRTEAVGEFIEPTLLQPDYPARSLKVYLAAKGPFRQQAQLIVPADLEKMNLAMHKVEAIVRERLHASQAIGFLDATYEKNLPVRP